MTDKPQPPRSALCRPEAGANAHAAPLLDWSEAGPRSRRFGDVYFSTVDGLAESRAVFLAGCGLPNAWQGRSRFVVGELGFGTGLNILALLDLWRAARPYEGHLSIFSVEAYPLTRAEAAQALAAWPQLDEVAAALLSAWPSDRRGLHRINLPTLHATFDLWIGEAAEGLAAWSGAADAWFLDGFAPAVNPAMWSEPLLALVAARSAPGARLATFTVAGAVRRGLEAVGFAYAKRPGFGRKRERLEAWLPPLSPRFAGEASGRKRVAIVGAGIAGAALARSLRRLGHTPVLIEAERPGAGASGNPVALVAPRLDAGFGVIADLHAHAFTYAAALYGHETPQAVVATGALQLETTPRDASRFDRIAGWPGFGSGTVSRLSSQAAAAQLDEPSACAGLRLADAVAIEPRQVLDAWLDGVETIVGHVAEWMQAGATWRLLDAASHVLAEADAVVLAAGPATLSLCPFSLPLGPVRGQVGWTSEVAFTGAPASFGSYALPLPGGGVLFGASHGRGDWGTELRAEDEARTLEQLAQGRPALATRIAAQATTLQGRASLRAATPDHLPLAGRLESDLYILSGLGARGFTLAPLLAEHVAALIDGAPSPLTTGAQFLVDPSRYADRNRATNAQTVLNIKATRSS